MTDPSRRDEARLIREFTEMRCPDDSDPECFVRALREWFADSPHVLRALDEDWGKDFGK